MSSRPPIKATVELELAGDRATVVLKFAGTPVWQASTPLETWHHEVVDLIMARTVRAKFAALLSRGLS